MDLRDLRYFETIARLEHLGRASKMLHRTQPALTSSIRRLESECGATLFERSGRGIRLTDAGQLLLKWAQRLRLGVEDAKRELSSLQKGLTGHVRIGIVPTAAQFMLPSVAKQLLAEAPSVILNTHIGLIDTLKPMLELGKLDLMICTEGRQEKWLISRMIAEDPVVVATHEGHELFRECATMEDLTRYRWALQAPGAPTRDWLDNAFDARGLPRPEVQIEASMLMILPNLIMQTGLLSFVSRHHLQGEFSRHGLKEVPVKEVIMQRKLVAMYSADKPLPAAAERFLKLLLAQSHTLTATQPSKSVNKTR